MNKNQVNPIWEDLVFLYLPEMRLRGVYVLTYKYQEFVHNQETFTVTAINFAKMALWDKHCMRNGLKIQKHICFHTAT